MNKIRQVNLSDIPALQELYQHTVLTVNRKDYTAEEVADWASCGDDTSHWNELFEEQHYVVAENKEGVIVGFVNPEKPDVPLNKNDAFQKVQKRHVQEKR